VFFSREGKRGGRFFVCLLKRKNKQKKEQDRNKKTTARKIKDFFSIVILFHLF